MNTSIMNQRILVKKQLLFVIEDGREECFGYYFHSQIPNNFIHQINADEKCFHFNLKSNGRLKKMMKFEVKDSSQKHSGITMFENNEKQLLFIGCLLLFKKEEVNNSRCFHFDSVFDFHGIENPICGKYYLKEESGAMQGDFLIIKKIMVIEMI